MLKRIVSVQAPDQYQGYLAGCVIEILPDREFRPSTYGPGGYVCTGRLCTEITPLPDGVGPNGKNMTFFFINAVLENYREEREEKESIQLRTPEAIRKEILKYVDNLSPERIKPIPGGLRGKLVSEFNRVFGGSVNRYHVVGWIFTGAFDKQMQTKHLTDAQIAGLLHWMELKHGKEGWSVSKAFYSEATLMYAYVAKNHVEMPGDGSISMQISPAMASAIVSAK